MTATFAERKRKLWGTPVPPGVKHGPNTHAAKYRGCDCRVCLPSGRRTWRNTEGATGPKDRNAHHGALRARKKGTPVPENVKHGVYGYRIYGCRCEACRAAIREVGLRQRNAWREKSHGRWTTVGEFETICWPPRDAGPNWVCPSCGSHDKKEVA